MSANQQLLAEIDAFLRVSGMAATTFGKKAVNNSQIVERMQCGGSVTLKTADAIRAYIHLHSPKKEHRRRAA